MTTDWDLDERAKSYIVNGLEEDLKRFFGRSIVLTYGGEMEDRPEIIVTRTPLGFTVAAYLLGPCWPPENEYVIQVDFTSEVEKIGSSVAVFCPDESGVVTEGVLPDFDDLIFPKEASA